MIEENRDFMVIERVLSPPYENPREIIYVGKPLELKKIKDALNLVSEEARKFFYSIFDIKRENGQIKISSKVIDYSDIERGELNPFKYYGVGCVDLPFDENIKTGLLKLLD